MDELTIQCDCTREFAAPAAAVGQTVTCPNCGRPIRVTADNPNVAARAAEPPEPNLNLGTSDGEPACVTPEPPRQLSQAEQDVNLFLDDGEGPPPVSAQKPVAAASRQPRADEESLQEDAQTAAASPATAGNVGDAREEAPRPAADAPSPFVPKGAKVEAKVPRCARCNRPFRGPWDRNETDEGTLCNICARHVDNFAWSPPPSRAPSGEQSDLQKELARMQSWSLPALEQPAQPPGQDEIRRRHVQMAALAGLALIAMLMILLWPENARGPAAPPVGTRELPQGYAYAIVAINAVLHIAAYTIAIYGTLHMARKLPNDTLTANIAAVLVVAVIVWGANAVIPFSGFIVAAAIVYRFCELSLLQLLMLGVFLALAGLLTWAVVG